jgi:predicted nucleotidyltransferase
MVYAEIMDINTAVDIHPHDQEILYSLLSQYLPNTTVWAYGSRTTGNALPWSDLDLVVFTKANQKYPLSLLKDAFEESNLPFRIDLLEWDWLPDNFRANIEVSHAVLLK